MGHFFYILPAFLADLPLFLVEGFGIVLAILRWGRHPRVSMFSTIGLGVMLVMRFLRVLAGAVLPVLLMRRMGAGMMGDAIGGAALILALGEAVGLALVVAAIYALRKEPVNPPAESK